MRSSNAWHYNDEDRSHLPHSVLKTQSLDSHWKKKNIYIYITTCEDQLSSLDLIHLEGEFVRSNPTAIVYTRRLEHRQAYQSCMWWVLYTCISFWRGQ